MALTTEQAATLKVAAQADPAAAAFMAAGNDTELAAWFNAPAAPKFTVWRSAYTPDEKAAAIDVGITQLDALTASKRDSLLWWAGRTHNAALASTQAAMNDLTGSQNTLKNALLAGAKRGASVAEKALASGTGSDAVPATLSFEGSINTNDAAEIRVA